MELEIGKNYDVFSSRKGKFRIKLTQQNDDFVTGIIIKGRAKAILKYNEVEKGGSVDLRRSLTTFKEV